MSGQQHSHRRSTSQSSPFLNGSNGGLGLSVGTSSSNVGGLMSKRNAYPTVSTPSVYGDEEAARRGSPLLGGSGLASPGDTSFEDGDTSTGSAGGAQHASYAIRNDEYDELSSSNMAFRRSIDARMTGTGGSPYTTPLLGGASNGSMRNSNEYDPSHRYGGMHVPSSPSGKKPLLLNGIGIGAKQHLLPTSSLANVVPLSPSLGASMNGSTGGSSIGSPALGWKGYINGKRRIHPITLGPAFLLGILVALSGLFKSSSDSSSLSRSWSSTLKTPSSSSTSPSDTSSASLLSRLTRPAYTSHASGHIFMDQARIELGEMEHPVHGLIRNATQRWQALLAKQSKTLPAAVKEYKRRYGRNPPKGFDDWFRFAQSNTVVLLDEYDQIHRDIIPFTSLSRSLLASRIAELEINPFTHTFVVRNGKIEITGAKKELARASDQAGLMMDFIKWLPDVNITMSAHDGPSVLMDYALKEKHEIAGREGKLVTDAEAAEVNDDIANWGFPLSCPTDSRLRRAYDGKEAGSLPPGPSLVEDHLTTMDLCKNPEWQYLHGFTSWAGPRPRPLQPLFSFAKTVMHSDMLCVPLEQFVNTPSFDPPWEEKKYEKIIWRGSLTGVWYDGTTWWRSSQRSRLHFLSQAKEGSRWVRFTGSDGKIAEKEVDLATLNERYLDAGYVGGLHQCTPDEGGCEAIPKQITTVKGMDWETQNDYKYIIDMDGNAWSGRFHRLMASNSLVFKSTIFPEWYSKRVIPWYHYVPLKIDYTDLYDLMSFFSGDIEGKNGHDALAKQIATNGKEWTEKHWRWEDMQTYAFRLYLEWARVANPDQSDVDYLG